MGMFVRGKRGKKSSLNTGAVAFSAYPCIADRSCLPTFFSLPVLTNGRVDRTMAKHYGEVVQDTAATGGEKPFASKCTVYLPKGCHIFLNHGGNGEVKIQALPLSLLTYTFVNPGVPVICFS